MAIAIIKPLRKFFTKLLWLISLLIILFVLVLSIFKLTIPYWLEDKQRVVGYIETAIGGKVDFQNISLNWDDFHPVLQIDNFLWEKNRIELRSEKNSVRLKLWDTLFSGFLKTKSIAISGVQAEINVVTSENAESFNLKSLTTKSVKDYLVLHPEVLQQEAIRISDLTLTMNHTQGSNQVVISQLEFERIEDSRQVLIDAKGDIFERLRLVIEANGIPFELNSSLSTYLLINKLQSNKLSKIFKLEEPFGLDEVNMQAWLDFSGEAITSGRVETSGSSKNALVASIDSIVELQQKGEIYNVSTKKYEVVTREEDGTLERFSGEFNILLNTTKQALQEIDLRAENIPLDFLLAYLKPLVSKPYKELVNKASPRGLIQKANLKLLVDSNKNSLKPVAGFLKVKDLVVNDTRYSPSIDFKQLNLVSKNKQWDFDFLAEDTFLRWAGQFVEPIAIDELKSSGSFNVNKAINIQIEEFSFKSKSANATAEGKISIQDDSAVSVNLYAEATQVDISKLYRFWPRKSMSDSVTSYLDSSLVSGKVPFAKMVWRGAIEDFPYKKGKGQFDIEADVKNTQFIFDSNWPVATEIDGIFYFENEKILVKASKGRLSGNQLNYAEAEILDIDADALLLNIKAQATSDYPAVKQLYGASPLKEWIDSEVIGFEFDKRITSQTNLSIIIDDQPKVKVDGRLLLDGNAIKGFPHDISLSETKGELHFDNNGLYSKSLSATLVGNRITLNLKAGDYTDDGDLVQLSVNSIFDINQALKNLQLQSPLKLSGKSEYNLHYRLSSQETESVILRSNLVGTKIEGPYWLAKESQIGAPVLLTILKKGQDVNLRAVYKDTISSNLLLNLEQSEQLKGIVALGNLATEKLEMPQSGVIVEGHFDEIIGKNWLKHTNFDALGATEINTSREFDWPVWLKHIKVTTPSLTIAGQQLTNVRFTDAKFADEVARFNVHSEQGRGSLSIFKDGRKHLAIEYLNLDILPYEEVTQENLQLEKHAFANWQVECQKCILSGIDVGQITLVSTLENGVVRVRGDSQIAGAFGAYIEADWEGGSSRLKIDFQSPSAANLLQIWGLGDGLRETETTGSAEIGWQGGFHQFSIAAAKGTLSIDTGEGSITELSDKQARIFSLFSLQSLRRRLSLDFSDLFNDGFFYDSIKGRFSLKDGFVNSDNVSINGTAADVSITGTVDLQGLKVDQKVVVIPKLGSSLPLIAGWALEPTTGIIMFLINKIFEPVVDVVTRIEYSIRGDISAPVIQELGKKSKQVIVPDEEQQMDKETDKEELLTHEEPTAND